MLNTMLESVNNGLVCLCLYLSERVCINLFLLGTHLRFPCDTTTICLLQSTCLRKCVCHLFVYFLSFISYLCDYFIGIQNKHKKIKTLCMHRYSHKRKSVCLGYNSEYLRVCLCMISMVNYIGSK